MPTYEEVYNRLSNNKSAENNSLQRTEPSIRTWENYLAKISAGYEPINQSEPENSSGVWDYLTSGNIIDSAQAGLGHMGKHIGKTIEDVTRPDDVSIPDWHEQDSFAKRLQDYSEELIRNNSHQYEQNSVPYFLDMAMQSTPEFLTDLGISMAIGAALGGPAGAVVGGGANLLLKAKKARDLAWAISKAYQGSSNAAKVARAVIPGSAQEAIALGSGAVMEAQSEALDAEERYIEKAKADGTYVRGQTEEEARGIYNQVLKDQTAIISAFNVPQYGAIYGKAAKGLLGKAGTLARVSVPEAAEEMSQYADTQYRLDDPLTAQGFIDSGVTGALMGGTMHVAGRGGRYIADRLTGNPTEEQREAAELARKAFSKQNSQQTQNIYGDFRGEVSEALNSSETAKREAYGQAYNEALRDWTRNNDKRQIADDNVHDLIVRTANKYGVPPEKALAVAMIESNGNQGVVSPVGAIGVMQLMPETAEGLGVDPNDMEQNIDGGVRYLKEQYDRFGDWDLAFAAYNAGAGTVERYGGVPNSPDYAETQNYVALANDILSTAPDSQGNGQTRGGNIFGVENYDMPREQMESSVEGLKAGWSEVIPQIGGVLKSMGYDPVLTSAARTREHQMRINPDAPNSYHIIQDDGGDAIDISLSEGELTPEQEQAVLDYFKGTGLFNEVLYHSVVGGKHLHLGGLNVEKLRSGQSIQSRADQIFSENFNPNENKLPQWNDYYNDRRKQRQGQQHQRQEDTSQNKSEPPKPLFDLNAEDEQTQKLLEQFATERRNSSTGAQAAQDSVFFEPMFKDGKFQNTPENRAAIMERYGDEFTQWAQPQLQQSQPSQTGQTETNIPPKSEQPNQQTPPKPSNEPLIKTANEFLEKLKAQGGTENIATIFKLQTALDNGDTAAIEKILNQNGNATPSEQAQPQPQEDPIQNNKPPENVLSQPAQQTQENQTPPQLNANSYVQAALVQPIGGTSKAAKDARIEQGKKLTVLADQHGVKIPEPLRISLNNGATKAITETQKILLDSGKLFNSEPQQVQTPQAQTKFADDLSVAKQEIPEDKNARKSQGESILRVVNFSQNVNSLYPNGNSPIPRIDLPAGLEQALQRGDEKAIRKAQEIIENAGLKIETSPQETAPTTGNTRGNTAEVITGSRTPHQIRYKVVEASDLNSSHTIDNGGVFANENYPSELQPRDRERSDMQAQLISMGNNLNPTDLLDARDVNQGAPVTRQDGVVLNGNGRTAAISYAYEKGKGDPYKNALIQNAEKFGLNADEISKMNQPVLVRELTHSLTDEEMRDLTGTQTGGARMGASEQAQADAAKLSQATLNQFPQGDNVDLSQAESTDFLRSALNDIASPDELNSLTTADGKISQDGINRVRRALFANAYGDKGVVSRMSESTDDNTRNITNALLNAAPTIAKVQAAMKNGTAHNHDLSVIAKAVDKLSMLRDEGKPVSKYLQEQALFPEHADSEELKEILSFLDKNKHAPNKIASFLKKIANRIQNQGDPREENLFGSNEPAPLIDLIKGARREVENNGQQDLFAQNNAKPETPQEKFAIGKEEGNDTPVDTDTKNVVDPKNLTPQQKLIVKFGKMLGTEVVFVDNPDTRFYGVHKEGKTFINVNSKMPLGKVFWHESLHWLRNNNPELYKSLVKAAGITNAQRKAYLEETERTDLTTDAEIDEEIIADQFQDVAKRTGLLQSIAGKNRGLIQRVVQWLKDTMNKFIDHFRNPTGKLTTKQAQALADEFGRIATQLKDPNGDKIFRYNRRTHNIELADGRDLTESAIEEMTRKGAHHPVKYTFAGKKAKTADKDSLNRAKKMKKRLGDSEDAMDTIYQATGWFWGKDNKWRFEIPDNFDKIDFDKLLKIKDFPFPLDEIYDNPALFAAYPKLRDVWVSSKVFKEPTLFGQTQGNKITINWKKIKNEREEAGEGFVHEIQHVIQHYEDFSTGGDERNVLSQLKDELVKIKKAAEKIPNGKKSLKALAGAFSNARFARDMGEDDMLQEAEDTIRIIKKGFSTTDWKKIKYLADNYSKLSDTVDEIRAEKGEYETVYTEDGEIEEPRQPRLKYEAYQRLGGEQEAREVGRRLFNRYGTPTPHDEEALIVFGGKTYAMAKHPENKKNASENGDGELVKKGDMRGSSPPSAATANGTTDHWSPTSFQLVDNKGGVKSSATVDTNSPSENIAQDSGNSKPKYSIGASEKPSFFDKAAKKLKKALGIDHDRVHTVEDQRQAHSEAQKKAMDTYLRDPSKENKEKLRALRVTNEQLEAYQNGEEYMNSLGLIQNVGGSPSRVADKNIIFRAFFNLGDKAMDRLIRERDTFMRHYDKAMSLVKSKEDFEQFASLLWLGDTTQQEFTKEELLREGVPENVAEAYIQIRRQIERGYQMADKVQRRAREHAEYLTDEQIDDLHDNKFAYDIKDLNKVDDDGKKLVRWQEYENHVQTVRVTEKALEKLRADDSIQILSEKQLKQGKDKGKYDVKFREGKPALTHLKGYIPHFFHKYAVVIKDSNGKQIGGILGTGNTEREAIKLADEWLKNHNLESDREIYISPFEFNAESALGMDSNYAPTVGDKDFKAMRKNIAKNSEMSLAKAKQILDGSVKLKNRHRFLGQLMHRNGYKGYEKDMAWVLQHHFNSLSRYVALESEFKPQAISLFERVFGAFDKDHSKNLLAQYTKNYINDVNGVPAWIDEITNTTLNQNSVWRKYFLPVLGKRGIQTVAENITSRIAYLKLGMLNISSAVINYTQLTNAAGYLGSPTHLMKHFGQIAARGGKLTIGEMKILMGSGVAQDIGLDTSSGYDKNRGQNAIPGLDWLGNKSMKLFQNCDSLCRAATALAAYDKAIAEGKTKQQALNYAKEINRKANFSYGVEDAPNAMRRTGAYGKVMLQFYKYPFKQLEVISDFMPTSTRTTFKQKAVFWIPYIFQAGLVGLIPGFDWGDELLNEKFRLFPKDFLQKLCIKGTQEVFGKDSEVGKKVAQVMMYGAPALLGADVSKRVGLASLMPQDLPSFLLGAAGTTIVDGTRGAYNWAMHDEPGVNAVRAISPGLANIYTAAIEGETKDYRGRTVSIYETAWDRILRGMGFRSTDESVAADVQRINFNSRSDRLKDEQRAIDAYIADRSPENLKRLKELHIKPERVKEESRKKKLDRRGRLEQNMTKRERMDNRYLLEFAR